MRLKRYCYSLFFTIVSGFLYVLLPADLQAQIRIGPKAGVQLGRSVFEEEAYRQQFASSFMPGMQAGAVLNYRVSKMYSLHTELYYNQKGKKVKNKGTGGEELQNNATYRYLDMPVLLRLSAHKYRGNQSVEFYLNVGPSFNYWLGGSGSLRNVELTTLYGKPVTDYTIHFEEGERPAGKNLYVQEANRLQMSLDFGGGIILDLGRGNAVMIDLRNSLGVGKSFMGNMDGGDFGLQSYNDNFEAVNHVFALSVAYLLDIDVPAFLTKGKIRR